MGRAHGKATSVGLTKTRRGSRLKDRRRFCKAGGITLFASRLRVASFPALVLPPDRFLPRGDLHVPPPGQPDKRFHHPPSRPSVSPFSASLSLFNLHLDPGCGYRFYASEVVVALEYLHMMGIIYRDLKPENVLIRSDGHVMLTDFDLSLKGDDTTSTAQIVFDQDPPCNTCSNDHSKNQCAPAMSSCMLPNCIVPSVPCFHPKRGRSKRSSRCGSVEIVAEPIEIRSTSFVGTHEYLAPEVISGEGHGNAVDWWTLGVFIFELFYGMTPFKGVEHELTLANIVARALEFPKEPMIPGAARDLISQLLVKDSTMRLGSTMGALAIKHHPFFNGVNWALLRCATPPYIPASDKCKELVRLYNCTTNTVDFY
ncbi:serine/threonine-protein kinase D6PKL1-like [Vigna umbellata]|uniref:serine/threonine-protein kinase D6PKL1-like n=1 Tax=Vigna umbellata TaxID=87088 RepID=UPI001F5E4B83|nr:serine/threonine-protein kinase D6PKL1-like [Vigna umbellata]